MLHAPVRFIANGKKILNSHQLPLITQLQSLCTDNILHTETTKRFLLTQRQTLNLKPPCCYCATSTDVIKAQQEQNRDGLLKRVLNKVGLAPNSKTRLRVASQILYEGVADKVNYLQFFQDYQLPNTFNSWFLVTELHVWLLLVRAMAEGSESGEDGRYLRNCIVEAMWGDVNKRAKKLGGHNPSQTRAQIETLSEQFQAALIAYDEGIMSNDIVLAAALWRRFFAMKCDDYTKIERLVCYVRQQMHMLDKLERNEFLNKSKIPWLDMSKINVP